MSNGGHGMMHSSTSMPSGSHSMPGMNHSMPGMNHSTHHMHSSTPSMHHHPTTAGAGGHAGHGGEGADSVHVMEMFFHTNYRGVYVLFKPFELQDIKALIVACVVLFVVAFLYEGLKVLRAVLQANARRNGNRNLYVPSGELMVSEKRQPRNTSWHVCLHVVQSVLHVLQVTISYLLMLAVMTFNVWIGLSVVLGAGFGYLAFGWKTDIVVDRNEHCM